MTVRFSMKSTASRCCAAACSPARIYPVLDTTGIPAVSICVVRPLLGGEA